MDSRRRVLGGLGEFAKKHKADMLRAKYAPAEEEGSPMEEAAESPDMEAAEGEDAALDALPPEDGAELPPEEGMEGEGKGGDLTALLSSLDDDKLKELLATLAK